MKCLNQFGFSMEVALTGKNVSEFVAQSDIDGVLIGGASLSAEDFSGILNSVGRHYLSD